MFIAAAALVCLWSCNPEDKPNNGGKDNGGKEEQEYVAPITIDGDFADWAKLDASKVASATCPDGAKYTNLKAVKVYADANYVFFYCEITPNLEGYVTMDVFANADNSAATGGYADHFGEPDSEWLFEGNIEDWDCGLYKWWGEVGGNGWNWTDPSVTHDSADNWGAILGEGSGFAASAGDLATGKFEFSILREAVELVEFADEFTLGFMLSADWAEAGFLPTAAMTDDNPSSVAPKLKVKVVK